MPHSKLDVSSIRDQFPVLKQYVYGKPLIYLDNAATTQKPLSVISSTVDYYSSYNANVHRGVHFLSDRSTDAVENTRRSLQEFINAKDSCEIIFTKGTTDSINLVASSYTKNCLLPGDNIVISAMEHHSNILPWQVICKEKQAELKVIPILENGDLDMEKFHNLMSESVKIVSIAYVSNTLGTINPVKEIVSFAHKFGAVVLIDAAQALAHLPIDVQDLDCDFLAASAHKAYGPTGVGILYAKQRHLEDMPPYQSGGGMVDNVTFNSATYSSIPYKFEAGTPNIAGIIAFREALKFINEIGFEKIRNHECSLLKCLLECLSGLKNITFLGSSSHKSSIVSLYVKGVHSLDLGMLLDANAIAVRTGNLCTQPLLNLYGSPSAIRISCAVYNTEQEILQMSEEFSRFITKLSK